MLVWVAASHRRRTTCSSGGAGTAQGGTNTWLNEALTCRGQEVGVRGRRGVSGRRDGVAQCHILTGLQRYRRASPGRGRALSTSRPAQRPAVPSPATGSQASTHLVQLLSRHLVRSRRQRRRARRRGAGCCRRSGTRRCALARRPRRPSCCGRQQRGRCWGGLILLELCKVGLAEGGLAGEAQRAGCAERGRGLGAGGGAAARAARRGLAGGRGIAGRGAGGRAKGAAPWRAAELAAGLPGGQGRRQVQDGRQR